MDKGAGVGEELVARGPGASADVDQMIKPPRISDNLVPQTQDDLRPSRAGWHSGPIARLAKRSFALHEVATVSV